MTKRRQKIIIAAIIASLMLSTGCSRSNGGQSAGQNQSDRQLKSFEFSADDASIPLVVQNGISYVPLLELTRTVGFQSEWNTESKTLSVGDIDVIYRLTADVAQVEKEGEVLQVPSPPVMMQGVMYAPVTVVTDLFQEYMHYKLGNNQLIVHGTEAEPGLDDMDASEDAAAEVDFFADDPNDPYKGEDLEGDDPKQPVTLEPKEVTKEELSEENASFQASALRNVDMNALIRVARRYMGVPYLFGAGPYAQTRKFDCSSYTQYVFAKFGVRLNRVSRNQARQGVPVSRRLLRKGDLVFFYVPGRFRTNRTVGHVGIYIGNGKMINTFSNRKGVHITYINKGYWSKKYLSARRVAN